jgi:D-tyrosyl-tRNA(Tyr) deacylase
MRAVVQRVTEAHITINKESGKQIGQGLVVLLGIEQEDSKQDIDWLTGKISRLRIFPDSHGVMNLSVMDVSGEVMIVSQFTLHANTKKGNRPSYIKAAKPDIAIPHYEKFIYKVESELSKKIQTGEFGAMMKVSLCNSGPVTIIIDTKDKK